MEFWIKAGQVLLSLSFLIVVHEFGHYLPAILFKTKVEKFYLFFDYKFSLFKRKIKNTEWGIGWIPLGGYVKIAGMVDESMDKEQLAQEPKPWEFRSKPAGQRLIIMLGGIFVNVIVGFLLYILCFGIWGEQRIDQNKMANGFAVHPYMKKYGFRDGDKFLEVEGEKVENPASITKELLFFGAQKIKVKHEDGIIETIKLPADIDQKMFRNDVMQNAIAPFTYLKEIVEVIPQSPALKAGLQKGDLVKSINGKELVYFHDLTNAAAKNKGKKVSFLIVRNGKEISKSIQIDAKGKIGAAFNQKITADSIAEYTHSFGFFGSFSNGFVKGYETLYTNVAQFKFVFSKKGAESLGGIGSIGKLFPSSWDWQSFLMLTAFLSFMLAVMNLLPIPALDGGHVVFLLYEMISGRAPSQRFMEIAQTVGFVLVLGLILFANGKDIFNAFK